MSRDEVKEHRIRELETPIGRNNAIVSAIIRDRVRISEHAQMRMTERGISLEDIANAIGVGHYEYGGQNGCLAYQSVHGQIIVLYLLASDTATIVTVMPPANGTRVANHRKARRMRKERHTDPRHVKQFNAEDQIRAFFCANDCGEFDDAA